MGLRKCPIEPAEAATEDRVAPRGRDGGVKDHLVVDADDPIFHLQWGTVAEDDLGVSPAHCQDYLRGEIVVRDVEISG
jgi:hypothetical protein